MGYTQFQKSYGPLKVHPWFNFGMDPGLRALASDERITLQSEASCDCKYRLSQSRQRKGVSGAGRHPYRNDIDKVILPQRVQDGGDGVLGDRHPQPLHAATRVHHNHYVFGGSSSLYVPLAESKGQASNGKMKARATTQPNLQLFLCRFWLKYIQSSGQCPIDTRLYHVP